MDDPTDRHAAHPDLAKYIDSVTGSGARIRQILVLLSMIAIVLLATTWNQLPTGWAAGHYESERAAYYLLEALEGAMARSDSTTNGFRACAEPPSAADSKNRDDAAPDRFRKIRIILCMQRMIDDEKKALHDAQTTLGESKSRTPGEESQLATISVRLKWLDALTAARPRLERYVASDIDLKHAGERLSYWMKARYDIGGLASIQALGLRFHSNDCGLIGGIALVVAVTWLRLALWRHANNLDLVFRFASRTGCAQTCYELVSMHQVVFPVSETRVHVGRPWSGIGQSMFGIPLFVYLIMVGTDLATLQFGGLIDQNLVVRNTVIEVLVLVILIFQAINCWKIQREITRQLSQGAPPAVV